MQRNCTSEVNLSIYQWLAYKDNQVRNSEASHVNAGNVQEKSVLAVEHRNAASMTTALLAWGRAACDKWHRREQTTAQQEVHEWRIKV